MWRWPPNSASRAALTGYRKTNLLRELLEAGADVLCLQEVQSDAYQQFFQPHLSEKGYDGLYKAKTREGAMGKVCVCLDGWLAVGVVLVWGSWLVSWGLFLR